MNGLFLLKEKKRSFFFEIFRNKGANCDIKGKKSFFFQNFPLRYEIKELIASYYECQITLFIRTRVKKRRLAFTLQT
jgi:hypothetical protein